MNAHVHAELLGAAALSWQVLAGLFATGMAGGAGHCVPMCGPFVLVQCAAGQGAGAGKGAGPRLERARGMLLLPYHLGRLTTYSALGAVAGGLSGTVAGDPAFRWVLAAFLAAAALIFACRGAAGLGRWLPVALPARGGGPRLGAKAGLALARVARPLFRAPTGRNGYALGLTLGFLPCGMVYAALAAAAGIGDAVGGGLAMAAFGLGTMPALLAVGLAGGLAGRRWAGLARLASPPLMLANAAVLAVTAWHAAA